MAKYQIFTDSCSDLSVEQRKNNNIAYLHMGLVVDGVEKFADLDWIEYTPEQFYDWLVKGCNIKTTQVSYEEATKGFTPVLERGDDILYLACSSSLSGSGNIARLVANELLEKYPGRRIEIVDTLCGAFTEGLLVLAAAKKQQEGLSLDELLKYVEDNKFRFNQFATVETLTYLQKAGRIKGSKAVLGNIFHKKPIFISDRKGNNFTLGTVTGTKNADDELVKAIATCFDKDTWDTIYIGQGMAMDRALRLKKRFEDELNAKVEIGWIGPIVGATCGPGVIGIFCFGREVTRYDGDGIVSNSIVY